MMLAIAIGVLNHNVSNWAWMYGARVNDALLSGFTWARQPTTRTTA